MCRLASVQHQQASRTPHVSSKQEGARVSNYLLRSNFVIAQTIAIKVIRFIYNFAIECLFASMFFFCNYRGFYLDFILDIFASFTGCEKNKGQKFIFVFILK